MRDFDDLTRDELRRLKITHGAGPWTAVAELVKADETFDKRELAIPPSVMPAIKAALAVRGMTVVDDGYGCWLFLAARICPMCGETVPQEPPCPSCIGRETGAQGGDVDHRRMWAAADDHHGHGEDEMQERLVAAGAGL